MMGLAMSYTPKANDLLRKCPLFEKERVEFYERTTEGSGNSNCHRIESQTGTKIHVLDCSAFVEDKLTSIEEKKDVLRYVTPQFRAWAKVRVPPLPDGEIWQIGWIQACSSMRFINTYGEKGCTSWEFQELDTGLYPMISDSDGRASPWYGTAKQNVRTVIGPTSEPVDLMLMMHDNFYPSVTWTIPMPSKMTFLHPGCMDNKPRLSNINRDQTFFTWLVARNMNEQVWYVLKTAKWRAYIEINIDPKQPLGSRALLKAQRMSSGGLILPYNVMIPKCVLFPPNANSAQILVWRSASRHDRNSYLVVPPKSTAVKYKVQRKLGMTVVIKPQISQCVHGKLNLIGDCKEEHDTDIIAEIEAYLSMQHKTYKDQKKLEKISFLI